MAFQTKANLTAGPVRVSALARSIIYNNTLHTVDMCAKWKSLVHLSYIPVNKRSFNTLQGSDADHWFFNTVSRTGMP